MKRFLMRSLSFLLGIAMLLTAMPTRSSASPAYVEEMQNSLLRQRNGSDFNYDAIPEEKTKFINQKPISDPADLGDDPATKEEANEQIKNAQMPNTYHIKIQYMAVKDGEEVPIFQPYEATVGDEEYRYTDNRGTEQPVMSEAEKSKIDKTVKLPGIDGYTRPTEEVKLDYDYIKKKAKEGTKSGTEYTTLHPYRYQAEEGKMRVKHVFQGLYDKNQYGPKDGEDQLIYTTVNGIVGSDVIVQPLREDERIGYTPEKTVIHTRIPENKEDAVIEYRYNRDAFNIRFDMDGGSAIPSLRLYYGQTIPNLDVEPSKTGAIFDGWKANVDLHYKTDDGVKTLTKGTIFHMDQFPDGIKDAMPARDITFTALWKEKPTANYTIQFWTQKAESDAYDFIAAKVVTDAKTGSRPDLSTMMPDGIKFPEIEESLTNQGNEKELNKYYVRNTEKILEANSEKVENEDGTSTDLVKKVQPDGSTVYNIYYDRQVYHLLFEKYAIIDKLEAKMTLPDGTHYDSTKGVNKPYHFDAKFGQRLKQWPNDFWLIEKGGVDFPPATSFLGWGFNYIPKYGDEYDYYLDTPPYWLTSKDFIDKKLDDLGYEETPVTHSVSTGEPLPERTISLGPTVSAENQFAIYYIDYAFEGFDGKMHFNPDMAYTKIDTSGGYAYPAPGIIGFTPTEETKELNPVAEAYGGKGKYAVDLSKKNADDLQKSLDEIDEQRENNERSYFQALKREEINGVKTDEIPKYRFRFEYQREKYQLFLDTDPSTINQHSEFKGKTLSNGKPATVTDVYYDLPLRQLKLDEAYSLTEADRPAHLPEWYVFKGWAIDPEGSQLIKDSATEAEALEKQIAEKYQELADNAKDDAKRESIQKELDALKAKLDQADNTMPNYDIVLYAKWGEPDIDWKLTFDANGGSFSDLVPQDIATNKEGEKIQTSIGTIPYVLPVKESGDAKEQKFHVRHGMTVKAPAPPIRKGYDFLGWEIVRYKEDGSVDTSYKNKYGVEELYAFGNSVLSDVYLKAIWVKNDMIDILAEHYFLDEDFHPVKEPTKVTIPNNRVGEYTTTTGKYQGNEYLLIPRSEWDKLEQNSGEYKEYVAETERKNTYFQSLRVVPDKIDDHGEQKDNPEAKKNYFRFFYREFTKKHYTVNYLSTKNTAVESLPAIGEKPDDSYTIIPSEEVTKGNNDYDAVNFREIPGWKLISTPQRQLFFDVDSEGKMTGINGVASGEVNFYYKDIRVIKRKTPDSAVPDGYHRVIFKAGRDGSFGKDAGGKPIKEVFYDVIDGLEFRNIPVPQEQDDQGSLLPPVITPDPHCEFVGWQDSPLIDGNTVIRKDYTFTAKFRPLKDVIEITTGDEDLPDYFVDVYLDTTDKADASITDNQFTGESKKHFKVNPEKIVEIPAADPQGGGVKDKDGNPLKDAKGKEAKWQFKSWQVKDDATKVWNKGETIKDQFTEKVTTIVAQYNLKWSDLENVPETEIGGMWVFESLKKDDGTWVNNFMPKKDQFDQALEKVTGLPEYQSYRIITSEEDIYDLVKEEDGPVGDSKPRTVEIQAEVTFKNGTKKVVNIPVKVFKNIYRALNDEDKPNVVKNNPELSDYVKVTVNPTDKAVDKQRKVYYVNPLAQVLIPEKDPKPIGNLTFEGWYYKDPAQVSEQNPQGRVEVDLAKRMEISQEREIIAAYSTPTQPILPLEPTARKIIKNIGDSLTVDDYEAVITPPKDENGKDLRKILTIKLVKPKAERVTTEKEGDFKEAIEVFYEDGSSTIIDVDVKVVPDFVPQIGDDKPEVPENFVKVTCDPTDKAVDSTPHIYWVNPEKKVTLPEGDPVGKEVRKADGTKDFTWLFTKWDKALTGIFEEDTTITAEYQKDYGGLTPIVPISDPPVVDLVPYGEDKITGNGIPGSKITVTDEDGNPLKGNDGNPIEVSVDETGKFTIPTNRLPEGKKPKDIYLTQTEKEKMPSEPVPVVEQGPKYIVSEDPDHPGEVPEGYVRLIFDATEDGTVEGHRKKVIDVREDVSYKDADLRKEFPQTATYEDGTMKFDRWNPLIPETGMVEPEIFIAQYTENPKVITQDPKNPDPVPEGYVRLIFDATIDGTVDGYTKKILDVRQDVTYADPDLQELLPTMAVYKDATKRFDAWDSPVPTEGPVTEKTYTALYVDNPKVIVSEDPDHPGEVPEGYVRLIFDATEDGTVEGHRKKIIDVRNDVTYEDPDLRAVLPETARYKDGTKLFDRWSPNVPKTGLVKDQTFEAQYKGKPVVPKPDPEPGTDPDKPNPEKPNPGTNPEKPNPDPKPGTDSKPGTDPGNKPGSKPGSKPEQGRKDPATSNSPANKGGKTNQSKAPHTGDLFILPYALVGLASLALFGTLFIKGKKKRPQEK